MSTDRAAKATLMGLVKAVADAYRDPDADATIIGSAVAALHRNICDQADTLGALDRTTRERDEARATLAKAYEHAAHQAGVTQFASKQAWRRQMYLLKEGSDE